MMKRCFGSLWTRSVFGSGTTLTKIEYKLIEELVRSLPGELRGLVEAQFESYNLVQREIDGRALNFYRKVSGRQSMDGLSLLKTCHQEACLAKISVRVNDEADPIHATLNAVSGRVFCVAFSRRVDGYSGESSIQMHSFD